MGLLGKTTLEKLSTLLLVAGIIVIFSLFLKYFWISVVIGIIFVVLCPIWFRVLSEELVISFIKRNHGHCRYDELVEEYSEKITSIVSRLEKQSIVKIQDGEISLIDENYPCTFDKFRRR